MTRFILRRLASALFTMVAASLIVFVLVEASPGNVARKTLGPFASDEQVQILYERLQLNDSLIVRYGRWLGIITGLRADPLQNPSLGLKFHDRRGDRYVGNFGFSTMMKIPVADVIWQRLANSAALAGLAFLVIVPLAIAIGILAGLNAGRPLDRAITTLSTVFASIPEFASAVLLMSLFAVWLGWLPGTSPLQAGGFWPIYSQFVLPVTVLTLYVTAYVARFVRASMIEVMATPYVRTLMSGVVVTEVVFAYPGLGRLLLETALFGDIALIEAATLIAVLIAVATQLAGDIGYMLLNPRIRFA
ncbi:MAG: ABC transporter permease [Proteobacteria bacterium]|nr:ABC transporter permease [Pseudomonadota bacterium]